MSVRFFWDFHGPNAEKTARHFLEHLLEFLAKHDFTLTCGCDSSDEGHWFAYCDPPDMPRALLPQTDAATSSTEAVADRIGRALRPQRVEASAPLTD